MDPSIARSRLLAQHDELRGLMAGALELAALLHAGEPVAGELAEELDLLRRAFEEHNELETSLLEPMLRATDAWGPARVARMVEEHGAEHTVFNAFLARSVTEIAADLADFAEEIEAHMLAEERTFLSPLVLRDDVVTDGGPSS